TVACIAMHALCSALHVRGTRTRIMRVSSWRIACSVSRRERGGLMERDESSGVSIVTGANAGIGHAIAAGLLERGRHVVLACRSRTRALEAASELGERTGRRPDVLVMDLENRASVIDACGEALARFSRIDRIVLNAAVWSVTRRLAPCGHERTWATNV